MKKKALLFICFTLFTAGILSAQDTLKFENMFSMKNDSYGLGTATDGKFIFAVGGGSYSFQDMLNTIDRYSVTDDIWDRIGSGIIPRRYLNVEYVPSLNKIYIFNGEYSSKFNLQSSLYASRSSKIRFTDVIEIVDLNSYTVTTVDSNPYPVLGAGSAVWDNMIYFFGGWNPMGYSDRLYRYNPAKDDWKELEEMPESKRTNGQIVDGVLYTFGGYDNSSSDYKTIHAYDIKTDKWTLIGELPTGVSATATASDGKNIWIVGSFYNLGFIASFDTQTKTVKTYKSNMIGRRFASAQIVKNKLYVFGGNQTDFGQTCLNSVQCADISKYIKK
jgi:N-acetylneuraminic acid mutarotase